MSYWKFKKEKLSEDWRNFTIDWNKWWHENGDLAFMFGPLVPGIASVFIAAINIWIGIALFIVSVSWVFIFFAWMGISNELDNYREWKKKRVASVTQQQTKF